MLLLNCCTIPFEISSSSSSSSFCFSVDQSTLFQGSTCRPFLRFSPESHGASQLSRGFRKDISTTSPDPFHPSRLPSFRKYPRPIVNAFVHAFNNFPLSRRKKTRILSPSNSVSKSGHSNSRQEGIGENVSPSTDSSWEKLGQKKSISESNDLSKNPKFSSNSTLDVSTIERALYGLRIVTSKENRSEISTPNSGIQIAIIGESTESVLLQRIGRFTGGGGGGGGGSGSVEGYEEESIRKGEGEGDREVKRFLNSETGPRNGVIFLGSGEGKFERGSEDEIWMVGPNVGKVHKLWIAPEAGTWGFQEASLLVVPIPETAENDKNDDVAPTNADVSIDNTRKTDRNDENSLGFSPSSKTAGSYSFLKDKETAFPSIVFGISYVFRGFEPVLIGDSTDFPALELKPFAFEGNIPVSYGKQSLSTKFPLDSAVFLETGAVFLETGEALMGGERKGKTVSTDVKKLQKESMEEYRELKKWLLQITGLMSFFGTLGLGVFSWTEEALAFGFGGALGFLYMLRLQNKVDNISTVTGLQIENEIERETTDKMDKRTDTVLKEKDLVVPWEVVGGSLTKISVAFGVVFLFLNVSSGVESSLPPPLLFAAVVGFSTHKVAVLFSAFRSFSPETSSSDNSNKGETLHT